MKFSETIALTTCSTVLIAMMAAILLNTPTHSQQHGSRWQEAASLGVEGQALQPLTSVADSPQALAALEQSIEQARSDNHFWLYKHLPQLAKWEAKLQHAD